MVAHNVSSPEWQRLLDEVKNKLEWLILATPTGVVRNHLCDANIHLMAAREEQKK